MAGRLEGKVALVTGAAQGIGEAIARRFAREGARVVVADILDAPGRKLASELGDAARYAHLDVTRPEQWSAAVEPLRGELGGIDVLVNNAGIGLPPVALADTPVEEHRRIQDVNSDGVFFGMRAVADAMKAAGRGSIVNISSIDGIVGVAGLTSYVASKFAVRGMTRSAALELGRFGIRVNSIHPGFIDTPMLRGASAELSRSLQTLLDQQPIARLGTPDEIASLALFLASDESSYCTGAEFVIDGGHTAGPFRWYV
jgi:3alpha(or 20beta)-hydroxysteroid dehydrogenase